LRKFCIGLVCVVTASFAMAQSDPALAAKAKLEAIRVEATGVLDRNATLKPKSRLPSWVTDALSRIAFLADLALEDVEQFIVRPPQPPANPTLPDCEEATVQAAFNAASAGATITCPPGTYSWTTAVSWTAPANVTFRGSGSLSTLGGGDATIIQDDYAANAAVLHITMGASGTFRIAGFTFRGGSGSLKDNDGVVTIDGSGAGVRIDHMHFDWTTYTGTGSNDQSKIVVFGNSVWGVLDHSIFDPVRNAALYVFTGEGSDGMGNTTWASPTNFGCATLSSGNCVDYVYLEDNLWRTTDDVPFRIGDGWSAGKVVWRFNTITGGAGFEMHATGHAGDDRGIRASEGYGNQFNSVLAQYNGGTGPPYAMADVASGAELIWGNTVETNGVKNVYRFHVTRKDNGTYTQQATPTGWGYCGTAFNGTGSNWDKNDNVSTGTPCLDQPGRGQGDLLVGFFPTKTNNTTGTIAWPNQALEPVYIWMNTATATAIWGGTEYLNDTGGRVAANLDYYAQASGAQTTSSSPFNGTTGTGWGTIARRPSTCTTGVGYFATDEGSWNTSSSNPQGVDFAGADGRLYKCTSTNTWTLYYTPYTYPHPLNQ
jgi:hypothetical protein